MTDSIRPRGTVEVICEGCGWSYWVACDDPDLPDGPWTCASCMPLEDCDGILRKAGVDPEALAERGLAFVTRCQGDS